MFLASERPLLSLRDSVMGKLREWRKGGREEAIKRESESQNIGTRRQRDQGQVDEAGELCDFEQHTYAHVHIYT